MPRDTFTDFGMKAFFTLIVGICSLMTKILIDIESNIRDLNLKVSLISTYSERHEKQIETFQGYSMVLQRIESELQFHEKQIEALQSKRNK